MLRQKLEAMRLPTSSGSKIGAFAAVPTAARRGVVWVRPELVAQVRFSDWTTDNLVRQSAFLGLREDKPARRGGARGGDAHAEAECPHRCGSAV